MNNTTDTLHTRLHYITVKGMNKAKPFVVSKKRARRIYKAALKLIREIGGDEFNDAHPTNPKFTISWMDVDSEFLGVEASLRFVIQGDDEVRIIGDLEAL